jgi:CMP-N-acetylneuraminic acid synthetase
MTETCAIVGNGPTASGKGCWIDACEFVVRTSFALEHQQRINYQDCLPYELPLIESIDIDTPEDLKFARYLWSGMHDV